MKKIFLIFFLTLFIPLNKVNGASCNYQEIVRLKKIASNVNVSYVYSENNGIKFHITLVNLNKDIYFVDSTTRKKHLYINNEITISNYNDGEKVTYTFYSNDINCTEKPLYTISISLPAYNEFYKDKVCEGAESYNLCQKWSNHNYDYDTFVKKVQNYKLQNIEKEKEPVEEPVVTNSLFQIILQYLVDYYYIFLMLLIIGSVIGIRVIDKQSDIYN